MLAYERQAQIQRLLAARGQISVQELTEELGASAATVRRDLRILADRGLVDRRHGGVVAVKGKLAAPEPPLLQRGSEQLEQKRRIGRAAAAMVKDGQTIILTGGTTTTHVASALHGREGLTVITNALNIAFELAGDPGITLVVIGGLLRQTELSLVGPIAEKALQDVRADVTMMGIRGIHLELGLTNDSLLESANDQKMIACAPRLIIVADHSKLGQVAPGFVAPIGAVDVLVTDCDAPDDTVRQLREQGVEVVTV